MHYINLDRPDARGAGRQDAANSAAPQPRRLADSEAPAGPDGLRPVMYEEIFRQGDDCTGEGGGARAVAVRWACAADGFQHIAILEAETCSYRIVVHSPDMCD